MQQLHSDRRRESTWSRASRGTVSAAEIEQRVRAMFFAHGSWLASRYGVGPDAVLRLVDGSNLSGTMPSSLRHARGIEDLIVLAACLEGHCQAWIDAGELIEPALARAASMRLEHRDAIVHARRFWCEVRAETFRRMRQSATPGEHRVALQDCPFGRPLQNWLVDRLLGGLEAQVRLDLVPSARRLVLTPFDTSDEPLRLAD